MFIFPNSKWDPGDIILHSTLSLTSDAAGNQLALRVPWSREQLQMQLKLII